MRAVRVLVGHGHHGPVSQLGRTIVRAAGLQPQDLFQVGYLLVGRDLVGAHVAHVHELAAQGKHAEALAPNHGQTRQRHRLCAVALCEDERALLAARGARPLRIIQLLDAGDRAALCAVCLLKRVLAGGVAQSHHSLHQAVQLV